MAKLCIQLGFISSFYSDIDIGKIKDESDTQETATNVERIKCKNCDDKFVLQFELQRHKKLATRSSKCDFCEYESCTLKGLEKHKQEAHKDVVNKPANSLETLKNQVLQNQEKGRWAVTLQKLDDQASEDSKENNLAFDSESREVSSAGHFDQAISNKNESEAPKKIDTTHLIGTRIGKSKF